MAFQPLRNKTTNLVEDVPYDKVQGALSSGAYSIDDGTYSLVNPDTGKAIGVNASNVLPALNKNYSFETPQQAEVRGYVDDNSGLAGDAKVFAGQTVNQALIGAPKLAVDKFADPMTVAKTDALEDAHPWSNVGGFITGVVGSFGDGLGELNLGAKLLKGGANLAEHIGLTQGAERLGTAAAEKIGLGTVGQQLAAKISGAAGEGVAQGALLALPTTAIHLINQDPASAAENLLVGMGVGGLLNGGFSAFSDIARPISRMANKVSEGISDAADTKLNQIDFLKNGGTAAGGAKMSAEDIASMNDYSDQVKSQAQKNTGSPIVSIKDLQDVAEADQTKISNSLNGLRADADNVLKSNPDLQTKLITKTIPDELNPGQTITQQVPLIDPILNPENMANYLKENFVDKHRTGYREDAARVAKDIIPDILKRNPTGNILQDANTIRLDMDFIVKKAGGHGQADASHYVKAAETLRNRIQQGVDNTLENIKSISPEFTEQAQPYRQINQAYVRNKGFMNMLENQVRQNFGKVSSINPFKIAQDLWDKQLAGYSLKATSLVNNTVRDGISSVLNNKSLPTYLAGLKGETQTDLTKYLESKITNSSDTRANRDEAFFNLQKELSNPNPQHYIDNIAQATHPVESVSPQVANSLTSNSVSALTYLQSKIPKNQNPPSMFPETKDTRWKPSQMDLVKWNKTVEAVNNPLTILRDFHANQLTAEQVDAVKNVYPHLYQKMVNEVVSQVSELKAPPSIKVKNQLSILLGKDVASNSNNLQSLQAVYQNNKQAQGQQGVPAPKTRMAKLDLNVDNRMGGMEQLSKRT